MSYQPTVRAIYPNARCWPSNTLRFHVHFAQAMERDEAMEHVSLQDEHGQVVTGAMVDMADGLWDRTQCVLTVLFHPGRVKSGLISHEQFGRCLAVGHRYRIVVSREVKTRAGQSLASSFAHRFRCMPPVTEAIDTSHWHFTDSIPIVARSHRQANVHQTNRRRGLATMHPVPNSFDSITVHLHRNLDWLSLGHNVTVLDALEQPLAVRLQLIGRRLRIHPQERWRTETISLHVNDSLEDCCGNRMQSTFESNLVS